MAEPETGTITGTESVEARILRRLGSRTIALVGMMGAGKSSIGKRLGARLGLPFVDADSEIEQATNATISEIFEKHGEPYFRDGERRVIRRLLDERPKVLATGGGAFIQPETRAAIREGAVTVWLKADRDLILSRVRRRSNRPLLKTVDLESRIDQLIAERYPVYAEADIHVQSRDVAHDVVIEDIVAALIAHLDRETVEAG
jgi:shikimate kinase